MPGAPGPRLILRAPVEPAAAPDAAHLSAPVLEPHAESRVGHLFRVGVVVIGMEPSRQVIWCPSRTVSPARAGGL